MTMPELTSMLAALGVHLSVRLVVDALRGVLTPELRDSLTTHVPQTRRVLRRL